MNKIKKYKESISFYFPDYSCEQLFSLTEVDSESFDSEDIEISGGWQKVFCRELEFSVKSLPWNQLRALQFDIDEGAQTVACCDPIMMQMTHRGAYLWGQHQLNFSKEEVIQIIAQINQQLMGDGECFYLLDNNRWLYTNTKYIELNEAGFEPLIGKDQFGFRYSGKDGNFWQQLANEIQMLIKQMMDYQGLTQTSPEMMVNVHFWGDTKRKLNSTFESVEKSDAKVFVSDNLIENYVKESAVEYDNLSRVEEVFRETEKKPKRQLIVVTAKDNLELSRLVGKAISHSEGNDELSIRLVTQNKILSLRKPSRFIDKILALFGRESS